MALKEVFQHSIALCDIDPQLAGVTCKQVWEALKTAYLNRHEYLDFFLDSKPLKTETVGKRRRSTWKSNFPVKTAARPSLNITNWIRKNPSQRRLTQRPPVRSHS